MRSLKKLITVVIALAMVLTCVGVPAFADTAFSDISDAKVADAVNKLVAYGIITGYDDGTFRPDNQITRAEFAAIVTRMKGVANNLPADSATGFYDLDNDSSRAWARPYVKAAVDLKIINGFSDGTFKAGEPVTYEQAVKMLVCAVGYEVVANSEYNKAIATNPAATWSAGYIAAANKHGITKGVITAQISQPASRGVVAVLTSNALEVPELVTDSQGNLVKPEDGKESTESNMKTITGTVTGTFYTGLTSDETGLQENEIYIDANEDKDDGQYTLSDSLVESIDLDAYIGRKVSAYYDNLEGVITSIRLSNTNSTIIKEGSIEEISGNQIQYRDENGRNKSENLSDCTFIVNGKHVDSYDVKKEFKNGEIEIFTAKGTKIAKVSSYEVFVVNSFDKNNEKVFLKYAKYNGNNYYQFPTRASDKPKIFVKSSGSSSYNATTFSGLSLSQYDIINYLESPSDSKGDPIRKMYVTKGSKSGKVTATLQGEREVEIGDETYYLTSQYDAFAGDSNDEKAPFELSDNYTFYLDYTGQIAAIKYSASATTGSWSYGYIVAVDTKTEQIGMLKSGGSYQVYDLKDSVRVDGVRGDADDAFDALSAAAEIVNANATSDAKNNDYSQPVRYSVSGGKIDAIDTVAKGEGSNDTFSYDGILDGAKNTSKTRVTAYSETDKKDVEFAVNSSTIVIYVPDNREDESAYDVMTPSSAFSITEDRLVEVFAVDQTSSNKLAKMVLVYGTNPTLNFISTSPYMIVSKVRFSGDVQTIEGYVNAAASTSSVNVSTEKFKTVVGKATDLVTGKDVEEGDVIRYIKDNNGEAIAIQMIYDASEKGKLLTSGDAEKFEDKTVSSTYFIAKYGTISAKDSTDQTIDILCDGVATTYKISSSKIYTLASNGDVSEGVIDQLSDGKDGGEASTIITVANSTSEGTAAKLVYIIE